jgi:proteasome accessory factor B
VKKPKPKRRKSAPRQRYGAAARLFELRKLLATPHGMTLEQIQERFDVGRLTAVRLVEALEAAGEPVTVDKDGRKNVYRVAGGHAAAPAKLSMAHVLALTFARQAVAFLEGTTIKESFDEIVEQLEATLPKKTFASRLRLDRKLFVVPDAPYLPSDRSDAVDAVLTAVEREERITVKRSGARGERAFAVDPYALLVFRSGLYVAGFSHHHQSERLFALDGLRDVEWSRGDSFAYPGAWEPSARYPSGFDLFDGPQTKVRVSFASKVAKYVTRRSWHPSQRIEEHADGHVELTMTVRGTTQVVSWVLGFGEHAEVMEPGKLRDEVAIAAKKMSEIYER